MTELEVLRQQLVEAQKCITSLEAIEKQLSDNVIWQAGEIAKHLDTIEASRRLLPAAWITPDGEGFRIRFSKPVTEVPLGWDVLYTTPVIAPDVLKDAQRYRWLSEYLPSDDTSVDDSLVAALNPQEIDAAIDAAMGGAND